MRILLCLLAIWLGSASPIYSASNDSLKLKLSSSLGEHQIKVGKVLFYKTQEYQKMKKGVIKGLSNDSVFFKDGSTVAVNSILEVSYWGSQEKTTLAGGIAIAAAFGGLMTLALRGDPEYLGIAISAVLSAVLITYPKRKFVIGKIWSLQVVPTEDSPFIFR